jgi:DNA-directed RNA polymerase III subunit RPC1
VTLRAFHAALQANLKQVQEDLNPLRCLELLQKIPNDDCELLLMDGELGRPERMILTHLLVPPIPIRPSVGMQSGQRY